MPNFAPAKTYSPLQIHGVGVPGAFMGPINRNNRYDATAFVGSAEQATGVPLRTTATMA